MLPGSQQRHLNDAMAAVIVAEIGDTGRFPGPAYW